MWPTVRIPLDIYTINWKHGTIQQYGNNLQHATAIWKGNWQKEDLTFYIPCIF